MKLTDEQREEIQQSVKKFGALGITLPGLNLLISSEQAWKEEAEAKEKERAEFATMYFRIREEQVADWGKIKQAIEVLRGLNAHMDFSIPIVSGESMGTFKDASGINEFFAKAHDFLSSLGEKE